MERIGTINERITYRVKDKDEYIKNIKFFSNNKDKYCIIQATNTIICNDKVVGYLRSDNSVEWYVVPYVYYIDKKVEEEVETPIILPVGEKEMNEIDDILNSVWKKEALE